MSTNEAYKEAKVAFVSDNAGSTISHINLLCLVALLSISLYGLLKPRIITPLSNRNWSSLVLVLEWAILVLPLILSMTIFVYAPFKLCFFLCIPMILAPFIRPTQAQDVTQPPNSPQDIQRPPSPGHTIDIPFTPTPTNNRDGSSSSGSEHDSQHMERLSIEPILVSPLAALTTYRAHMMIMTILSILAVDFPIFPRTLAKCETFGVSMMDLGVGSFVFSQGIVSALPLLKKQRYLLLPMLPKILEAVRKILPLVALGFIRLLSVKGVDYPEHSSEYGTHWNFFFTLAVLPVLQVFLHPLIIWAPIALIGILVSVGHQMTLSFLSLQNFALNAPRTGIISHNKEGLASLGGYLSIHLLGLAIGTLLLPPSPNDFRRRQKTLRSIIQARQVVHKSEENSHEIQGPHLYNVRPSFESAGGSTTGRIKDFADRSSTRQRSVEGRKKLNHEPITTHSFSNGPYETERRKKDGVEGKMGKVAAELCAYAVLWWGFLGMLPLLMSTGMGSNSPSWVGRPVSRRLANLPYVLWVAAFNTSFILCYMLLDILFAASKTKAPSSTARLEVPHVDNQDSTLSIPDTRSTQPPELLEGINRNGLLIFLLSNVMTGIVNLSISTMYASDGYALIVLMIYSLVLCAVAWGGRGKGKEWSFNRLRRKS